MAIVETFYIGIHMPRGSDRTTTITQKHFARILYSLFALEQKPKIMNYCLAN